MVPVLVVAGALFLLFPSHHSKPVTAKSLANTSVDGAVGQHFLLTSALKRRFEYWLSAQGELEPRQLAQRLAQSLRSAGWSEADIQQALAAFAHYQQYRRALAGVTKPKAFSATELKAAWAERDAVRRQFYSEAEIARLWGQDAALEDFTLRRLEMQALGLSEQALLGWQQDALAKAPPALQRAYGPSLQLAELNADPDASRDQLAAQYGGAAADRLLQAKAAQQAWRNKVAAYKAQLTELAGESQAVRAKALAQYQASHFSAEERKRLEVWLRQQLQ